MDDEEGRRVRHQGEREPPRALFNPMQESTWTLPMVCAWIIWRTPERVQDFWSKFQAQRVVLRPLISTEQGRDAEGNRFVKGHVIGSEPSEAPQPSLDRMGLTVIHDQFASVEMHSTVDGALDELVHRAMDRKITIRGLVPNGAAFEIVPPESFDGLLAFSYRHLDDPQDGCLRYAIGTKRGGVAFTDLRFGPQESIALWPSPTDDGAPAPRARSGAPGRPTAMHLVEVEFRRRQSASEATASNSAEAEVLAEWLATTHPTEPRLTAKTIRNKLGGWRTRS